MREVVEWIEGLFAFLLCWEEETLLGGFAQPPSMDGHFGHLALCLGLCGLLARVDYFDPVLRTKVPAGNLG